MTQEGFDKLQEELHQLRTTGRAEVSEKIRIARGFGDLSENSEYDEAKNDQAVMEARIAQLEEQLKHVEIIDHDDIATDAVSVGSLVKILDVEYGDEMTYRIVSSLESGGEGETITDKSPVGQALLGHDLVFDDQYSHRAHNRGRVIRYSVSVRTIVIGLFIRSRYCWRM